MWGAMKSARDGANYEIPLFFSEKRPEPPFFKKILF